MEHILNIEEQDHLLHPIFEKIANANTILFLGAGASVGDKKYLSKDIIEYYEEKIGIKLGENNITKWIDILSTLPQFSRTHFDNFVNDLLKKLSLTHSHEILASAPWREIITTNYDLLIEQAYDKIGETSNKALDLKVIKSVAEYSYRPSNTEVKYVKLNGTIEDKSRYPLAFSTEDFTKLNSFYKIVLNDLKNLSPEINFISIGYSYSDDFGRDLLDKFDSFNYRDKKWLINIDPFANENMLPFYTQKKICIIKCTFDDFFGAYKKWEEKNLASVVKKSSLTLRNSNKFNVPNRLLVNLDGKIKQLYKNNNDHFIKEKDFYEGEEPNFTIISRNIDVPKVNYLSDFKSEILKKARTESPLLPMFFVTGDFGIGKSTFCLRLINELITDDDLDLISFEIIDITSIRKLDLLDLITNINCKNILLYCEEIEVSSHYNHLLELRVNLSVEQMQDKNIIFLTSIRENIYERHKLKNNRQISNNTYELKLDGKFSDSEIDELLVKLKNENLINFRDVQEQNSIKRKIKREYDADSFIALMAIISSGKHMSDLMDCYEELSKEAQKAFINTALLHRYQILTPASLLKKSVAMDWDEFIEKVIKAEGKGILIQEKRSSYGVQPDLFFRTKHPLIADKLIDTFIGSKDKQYTAYENLIKTIEPSNANSFLINDLLKTFNRLDVFTKTQINNLFDKANVNMSDDPYFLLNYASNLQHRQENEEINLKKALNLLIYAESLLDYRNSRFIHRRAIINFELAKLFFRNKKDSRGRLYASEALELFNTKQLLDPCSSFSYTNYIESLIWYMKKANEESEESDVLAYQIKIEDLFNYAQTSVTYGLDKIHQVQDEYVSSLNSLTNQDYIFTLEERYSNNTELRPYTCILLYNYYDRVGNLDKTTRYLDELESHINNYEVVKCLFNIYGQTLHKEEQRFKLLTLSKDNPNIEEDMPFRYNFYSFMAEFYNNNYARGNEYSMKLRKAFNLNPTFHNIWKDKDGKEIIYEAKIVLQKGKFKDVKIGLLQLNARLQKGDYSGYSVGQDVKVKLHFYFYGLFAEIIFPLIDKSK